MFLAAATQPTVCSVKDAKCGLKTINELFHALMCSPRANFGSACAELVSSWCGRCGRGGRCCCSAGR